MAMLSRFVVRSVSLIPKASLLQYVSRHEVVNCKAAADRYHADYPRHGCRGDRTCDPFAHFKESGQLAGRVWHSELCEEDCTYTTAPFDWIDATRGSPLPLGDDDQIEVPLPFPFPFYGQVKRRAIISSNGFCKIVMLFRFARCSSR